MILTSDIYIDNDSLIVLHGLKNRLGVAITDASVMMTSFVDRAGSAVSGVVLPLQLNHIGNGDYEAVIGKGIAVVAGKSYTAKVVAVSGSGLTGEWFETAIAKRRVA